MWLPVDGSDVPKIPSGKGKRLIVLRAGNREEGLIDLYTGLPEIYLENFEKNLFILSQQFLQS
jgi:hypothetical protein